MKQNYTRQIKNLFKSVSAIFAAAVLIFSFIASAQTTTTIEDCKIKVTVNIAITGAGASDDYANKIKQEAEKLWNDAALKAGDCKCEFNLTVNVIKVDNCRSQAAQNHHCVTVKNVPVGTFHRPTVTGTAGAMKPGGTIDSGTGDWGNQDAGKMIAHEVGHLMGLDDEYSDGYYYYYRDSSGNPTSTTPTFIKASDFTDAKKQEIEANKPPGGSVVYMLNPNTNQFSWSRPNPGRETSIMASVADGAAPKDDQAQYILDKAGLKCPDECCCGDGKVDGNKGESCDPKATPNGCEEGSQVCSANCKCNVATPICGDGYITKPEECDTGKNPSGCPSGKTCISCKCIAPTSKPNPTSPPVSCIDKDNDGYKTNCGTIDCNDNDPNINPGKAEVCGDGIDNNCTGGVDENCAPPHLEVSATLLDFGTETTQKSFTVKNTGDLTLEWRIEPPLFPPFMIQEPSPLSGTLAKNATASVTVKINRGPEVPPGPFQLLINAVNVNTGDRTEITIKGEILPD